MAGRLGGSCTGFRAEGESFNATVSNLRIDFRNDTDNTVYKGPTRGSGAFLRLLVDENRLNANRTYRVFTDDNALFRLRSLAQRFAAFFSYLKALFGNGKR